MADYLYSIAVQANSFQIKIRMADKTVWPINQGWNNEYSPFLYSVSMCHTKCVCMYVRTMCTYVLVYYMCTYVYIRTYIL